jgi:hypothetical protein
MMALLLSLLGIALGCGKSYPPLDGMDSHRAFQAVVLPVLRDQCQGCHFKGGAMYRDLPFDDEALVALRGDELLLQLKGQGRERMAQWLALTRGQPDHSLSR